MEKGGHDAVMDANGLELAYVYVRVERGRSFCRGALLKTSKYERLRPVYGEYNIGPYRRSFRLSNQEDQDKITADMAEGVLTLTLPKAEKAKPRRIQIS